MINDEKKTNNILELKLSQFLTGNVLGDISLSTPAEVISQCEGIRLIMETAINQVMKDSEFSDKEKDEAIKEVYFGISEICEAYDMLYTKNIVASRNDKLKNEQRVQVIGNLIEGFQPGMFDRNILSQEMYKSVQTIKRMGNQEDSPYDGEENLGIEHIRKLSDLYYAGAYIMETYLNNCKKSKREESVQLGR